jgi:tetratricopeptide (TPR) repeat protein
MRRYLLAAMLTGTLPFVAAAQGLAQQWAWCRGHDPERLIRGCSAIIRSGAESRDNLARAFYDRGRAWTDKAEYDRAIRDFDTAIRYDPDYPEAYNNRALAYIGKGQPDQALRDFDEAVRLDPNYAIALFNRGLALQSLGRTDEAARSFAQAKTAGPRLTPAKE